MEKCKVEATFVEHVQFIMDKSDITGQ